MLRILTDVAVTSGTPAALGFGPFPRGSLLRSLEIVASNGRDTGPSTAISVSNMWMTFYLGLQSAQQLVFSSSQSLFDRNLIGNGPSTIGYTPPTFFDVDFDLSQRSVNTAGTETAAFTFARLPPFRIPLNVVIGELPFLTLFALPGPSVDFPTWRVTGLLDAVDVGHVGWSF